MLNGDFTPLSAVNIFVKDLGIVLDVARELKFPLPDGSPRASAFLAAASAGYGNQDDASIVKLFEKVSGTSVAQKQVRPGEVRLSFAQGSIRSGSYH